MKEEKGVMKKQCLLFVATLWVLFAAAGSALAQSERPNGKEKQSSQPKTLAFTHVTIIDVAARDSRRALKPDQTVVVTGDRITEVGGKVRIPKGAQVIDASGKYLIPGLWDMHVIATATVFPFYVVNGVTGVREMGSGRPIAALHDIRRSAAEGRLVAPRIVATGRPLDGPFPARPFHTPIANEAVARQSVVSLKQSGADFVSVSTQISREAYFAVVNEAKRQGIPFAGRVPEAVNAAEVSNAGQQSIDHLGGILASCSSRAEEILNKYAEVLRAPAVRPEGFWVPLQTLLETYDTKRAAALFSLLAKNGTYVTPMLANWTIFRVDFAKEHKDDPRMKYLSPALKQHWDSSRDAFQRQFEQTREISQPVAEKFLEMVKTMNSAGVRLLAGTYTPIRSFVWPGFSLHEELQWLVKAGLTPLEALQTGTLNPARYLGKKKELGTVERGKLADLVLLDENPLEDIRNTQKIAAVMTNGRYMDKPELQKMLSELEAAANKK
jgi:imidazolonepropionase-like amidohydrolase